ncbi:MAG TPA: 2-C-methyl-D-erythritol 4-phosphate cytidylyltransferase [Candidatus Binataceae bacterium]|nr:2-C-methyl-D-erythritol 4-phosphate cytidylyltransferase [Candidatus Binataceae bacterium]
MRASAIVVAAGSGTRLGAKVPKAFVKLGEATLLEWSLRIIAQVGSIDEVVVAVPAGREAAARDLARPLALTVPLKVVAGGLERQDSVRRALALTSSEAELVVIHDAARPFATPVMFDAVLEDARHHGGAIVAIPLADTLKRVDNGHIRETVPRAGLWLAQTPQAFRRSLLVEAHDRAARTATLATDDADLVERLGGNVVVVLGSANNLKITTPEDLRLAQAWLAAEPPTART